MFLIAQVFMQSTKLHLKWWLLLGGRAQGPYATEPVMTLRPCGLDVLNDHDL